MKKLFAVTRVLGPAWNHQLPLDQQQIGVPMPIL